MDENEALDEAAKFLEEYDSKDFDTQHLLAAAILWGEHIGAREEHRKAMEAIALARKKILGEEPPKRQQHEPCRWG
jgi:hypothetical protein